MEAIVTVVEPPKNSVVHRLEIAKFRIRLWYWMRVCLPPCSLFTQPLKHRSGIIPLSRFGGMTARHCGLESTMIETFTHVRPPFVCLTARVVSSPSHYCAQSSIDIHRLYTLVYKKLHHHIPLCASTTTE
uniref:Uncharacterized protein n=1 Tax=Echinococcus granulosus TaxID=6210 RepID=A0A068WG88_ECHGR|nr:hypothetical protein EgrG_002021100 [Echinococcus granulosus]